MSAPPAPGLAWMGQVRCDVGEVIDLGAAPSASSPRRRVVPLLGGTVEGPELAGTILPGGTDWQWHHPEPGADGRIATDIEAHYVIVTPDGAHVEVQSRGVRHGPAGVIARMAAGEPVDPATYYFRTAVRFATGAPAWAHLNRVLALAVGRREARRAVLDLWRVG